MTSGFHKNQTIVQGLHSIVAFSYADSIERNAATGFTDYDVYKLAIDLIDGTFWIILDVDGYSGAATWQNIVASTGGAVGGDLSGTLPNPTVIDLHISGQQQGSVLFYNGTHWVVLNPSIDGYVLTTHNTGANPSWAPVITDLSVANQTKGDLLYFDGSDWVVLSAGDDGYVLTSQGVGEDPIWSPSVGGSGGVNISAGTQIATSGTISFINSNGISFGLSNSNQITASYTVPTQSSLNYSNSNNISFGLNGSTLTASASYPAQTSFILSNSNGLSFGTNGSTITGVYTVPSTVGLISAINISGGTTSNNLTNFVFSNSNNVSFGLNGSTITATVTSPTQTNQTIGLFATGNTTQNSSTTLDARSLTFNGLGAATVGYSNGSIQVSVPVQTAQTQSNIQAIYDGANSISTGTIRFSNANGLSFGINGQTITGSYTVPNTAGLISNINISAGTTSNNLTALTFSNSNGLAFGLNGSVITGSYTVPTQSVQTEGFYAIGNTTGQSSSSIFDARTMSFSGAGNISLGYSGNALVISGSSPNGSINISAGTTSNNLSGITFSNSNGVSFGLNGSTLTGSIAVQTNQTAGFYAVGNTVGQSSSSTFDARTLSFSGAGIVSIGYSAGNIIVSVPSAGASVNVSAGTTSSNLGALVFGNSNGVSFGLNAGTITATVNPGPAAGIAAIQGGTQTATSGTLIFSNSNGITFGLSNSSVMTASYTVPSIAGLISGINVSGGTTSNNLSAITFLNSNGLAFGLNGSVITGSYTVPTQTNQSIGLFATGNTTQNSSTNLDARSLTFNGLGALTVGYSNGSIQLSAPTQTAYQFSNSNGISFGSAGSTVTASYTVPSTAGLISVINVSAGTTSNNLTNFIFSNSNNVSFGLNGSTITATVTAPAQTNQTIGLYALGNTTQNSSTTLDARSLSFNGLGALTVGYSNGSIQFSAPIQTSISFSNANGISFGLNASTLTASYTIPTQTNQTEGRYALGNTVGQSSSSTFDARTLSISGVGGISVGYSANALIISGPSEKKVSQLIWPEVPWQTNFQISNASFSLQHFNAKENILASQANLLIALSGNSNSSGALTVSLGIYTMAGSVMSLASSDSRQITWTSGAATNSSSIFGGVSGTRYRTVGLANWSISAGDYVLGMWFRTTNNGTWNVFGQQGPTIVGAVDVNETQAYLHGFSTSSFISAMAASVNVTDTNYVRTGGNALQQPAIVFLGSF